MSSSADVRNAISSLGPTRRKLSCWLTRIVNAALRPCREESVDFDSTATNFEQIFKTYSPDTVTKIL